MLPSAEALGVDTRSDDSCARRATGSEASNTSHWCTAHNYNQASETPDRDYADTSANKNHNQMKKHKNGQVKSYG